MRKVKLENYAERKERRAHIGLDVLDGRRGSLPDGRRTMLKVEGRESSELDLPPLPSLWRKRPKDRD